MGLSVLLLFYKGPIESIICFGITTHLVTCLLSSDHKLKIWSTGLQSWAVCGSDVMFILGHVLPCLSETINSFPTKGILSYFLLLFLVDPEAFPGQRRYNLGVQILSTAVLLWASLSNTRWRSLLIFVLVIFINVALKKKLLAWYLQRDNDPKQQQISERLREKRIEVLRRSRPQPDWHAVLRELCTDKYCKPQWTYATLWRRVGWNPCTVTWEADKSHRKWLLQLIAGKSGSTPSSEKISFFTGLVEG